VSAAQALPDSSRREFPDSKNEAVCRIGKILGSRHNPRLTQTTPHRFAATFFS